MHFIFDYRNFRIGSKRQDTSTDLHEDTCILSLARKTGLWRLIHISLTASYTHGWTQKYFYKQYPELQVTKEHEF